MIDRRGFLTTVAGLGAVAAGGTLLGCTHVSNEKQRVFDAHCHIIDPRFPLVPNQGYVPPHYTIPQYRADVASLNVAAGAVVSGSFQGFDQTYLVSTLKQLGPDWVGVAQVPSDISDAEIRHLRGAGVRAVRFNLYRGKVDSMSEVVTFAQRVYDIAGWHAELYLDAAKMRSHLPQLAKLPQIVIDHLGMTEEGVPVLLDLVDAGAKIKATGFGRVNMNVPMALERIAQRNPHALMFGTDLPSTRAKRPFHPTDLDLVRRVLGKENARKALWDNAYELYRPGTRLA